MGDFGAMFGGGLGSFADTQQQQQRGLGQFGSLMDAQRQQMQNDYARRGVFSDELGNISLPIPVAVPVEVPRRGPLPRRGPELCAWWAAPFWWLTEWVFDRE